MCTETHTNCDYNNHTCAHTLSRGGRYRSHSDSLCCPSVLCETDCNNKRAFKLLIPVRFFFLLCSGLSFPFFSLSAFVYFLWPVSYLLLFHVHEVANKQSGNIKYREHLESPFLLLRSQNSKDTHIHGIIHTHADKKDCMDGCVQILYTEVQRRMCTIHTAAHA